MPLFIEPALSEEVAALLYVQEKLAATSALQALFGVANAAAAEALIAIGPLDEGKPALGMVYAQLFPRIDEQSFICTRSDAVGDTAVKDGLFHLHIRRMLKQSEYTEAMRQDVFLFFLDRTSRMCEQFIEATELLIAAPSISRRQGPLFDTVSNPEDDSEEVYVIADFLVDWGTRHRKGSR